MEVKTWSLSAFPLHPLEKINRRKINKMQRAILHFISEAKEDEKIKEIFRKLGSRAGFLPAISFDLVAVFPARPDDTENFGHLVDKTEQEAEGEVEQEAEGEVEQEAGYNLEHEVEDAVKDKVKHKVKYKVEYYENIF